MGQLRPRRRSNHEKTRISKVWILTWVITQIEGTHMMIGQGLSRLSGTPSVRTFADNQERGNGGRAACSGSLQSSLIFLVSLRVGDWLTGRDAVQQYQGQARERRRNKYRVAYVPG